MSKWSLDWKQPRMKPCCAESYAEYRDMTDREEYEELVQHIRGRVNTTIAKCSKIPPPVAEAAACGAYILQYWINSIHQCRLFVLVQCIISSHIRKYNLICKNVVSN